MEYVPVLGLAPSQDVIIPTTHYFNSYLISIAEPTTSRGWTLHEIIRQMTKISKNKLPNMKLYLDSGGFQIIMGYIVENRIKEYTDVYHFILERYKDEIDYIFSLDINTPKFNQEKIFKYNDYSIDNSINLIKKYPEIADKQLFIVQSRFPHILEDWRQLMEKHEVEKYYYRYSFGGLVGLKKEIRSRFNHFVPMTIWLLTYLKSKGQNQAKHIHMLGQSSRIAIITGAILEKFFNVEITMDSSEIIRFTKISQKTPLIHNKESNYKIIRDLENMSDMIRCHSSIESEEDIQDYIKALQNEDINNQTFVEIVSQNLNNLISFANDFIEKVPIKDIIEFKEEDFHNYHELFQIGRLSQEIANNMRLIRELYPYYENGDFEGIHKHVKQIISNYYIDDTCKAGNI